MTSRPPSLPAPAHHGPRSLAVPSISARTISLTWFRPSSEAAASGGRLAGGGRRGPSSQRTNKGVVIGLQLSDQILGEVDLVRAGSADGSLIRLPWGLQVAGRRRDTCHESCFHPTDRSDGSGRGPQHPSIVHMFDPVLPGDPRNRVYFGGMRMPPSTRIVSAFMYGLVIRSITMNASSSELPSRLGNKTDWPRWALNWSDCSPEP